MSTDTVELMGSLHLADGDGWAPWQPGVQPMPGDTRTLIGVDNEGTTHLLRWLDNRPGMDPCWCALAWETRGRLTVPVVHALRENNERLIVAWRLAL